MAHQASDTDAKLIAQTLSNFKRWWVVWVKYDLRQASPISQINENHPAMIAAPVHPTVQVDGLIKVLGANLTGVTSAHSVLLLKASVVVFKPPW
jgi:hypothetical protein